MYGFLAKTEVSQHDMTSTIQHYVLWLQISTVGWVSQTKHEITTNTPVYDAVLV